MKSLPVEFTQEAEVDLVQLYTYISENAGGLTAIRYIERLEQFCSGLEIGSQRGSLRSDIRRGLRVIGFEKRTNIAFVVEVHRVVILRISHGGREWMSEFP